MNEWAIIFGTSIIAGAVFSLAEAVREVAQAIRDLKGGNHGTS